MLKEHTHTNCSQLCHVLISSIQAARIEVEVRSMPVTRLHVFHVAGCLETLNQQDG